MNYLNYDDYTLTYDDRLNNFNVFYKKKAVITDAFISGVYINSTKTDVSDFVVSHPDFSRGPEPNKYRDEYVQEIYYEKGNIKFLIRLLVGQNGIKIETSGCDIVIEGNIAENVNDIFPVCLNRNAKDLRCAYGKASSVIDNAVYNKITDTAIIIDKSGNTKLLFDENKCRFVAPVNEQFTVAVKENVLAEKYNIKFSPCNRNSTFPDVPIGWMTWYAVKFDACEEIVLKNAKWMSENLKDFGANTVWVDWEWYHDAFPGDRSDGVNSLMPDPKKYPNGLKYVSDKIRELGLIPSLWIGYTNEPCTNKYIEKYPDMVLVDEVNWCGRYFYDFTNPHYLNEYLPEAVENVHKWGYDAVKFDTLPIAIRMHNFHHDKMYDKSLTPKEAFCNVIKKTRELLGKDVYMLSCCGGRDSAILWASDIFDSARIGDDIFTWDEYVSNISRIEKFYPLHNIHMFVDSDNVVMREEFNNFEQAKARATIVSLLGLPMTFGDEFDALSEDRINLLKRTMPVLDIHPMDLTSTDFNRENLLINLNVEKGFENYLVSGVFNLTHKKAKRKISLREDLHLEKGEYLVYDYFRDTFLGKTSDKIKLDFAPYECRVLSVRPCNNQVQIISTSRHITQGALELCDVKFENNTLSITADLIKDDSYTVTLYVPDGYKLKNSDNFEASAQKGNILKLSFMPKETKQYSFNIKF